MLDDLFKVVKARIDYDNQSDKQKKVKIPSDFLFKCPRCSHIMFKEEFDAIGKICSECNYHSRLSALERLDITIDKDSFLEYDSNMTSKNPIDFPNYESKISDLQSQLNIKDGIITGECAILGIEAVICIMDSRFMMASMGSVIGEKITRAFESAVEKKLPVIVFSASGGARMQEGVVSLMQMAKTSAAIARHSDEGLLYITVMTDPTTGGVTASFASLGDIIIAEPKVLIGFAGRRVIEGTIKQRLPDDFQSAEFLLENGFIDIIVERKNMKKTLSNLLRLHTCSGGGSGE